MSDDISKRNAEIADIAKYISQLMNSGISEDEKSGHAVVLLERMRVLFYGKKNIDSIGKIMTSNQIFIERLNEEDKEFHAKKAFDYGFETGHSEGKEDLRINFIQLLRLDEYVPELQDILKSPYQDPKEFYWTTYKRLNYAKKEKPPVRPTSAS